MKRKVIIGTAISLFLILILSGCTFPWEEERSPDAFNIPNESNIENTNNDLDLSSGNVDERKLISEIVYQEQKNITDLNNFAKEARKIALEKIGPEAMLKRIEFSYLDDEDYISYTAIFLGDDKFLDTVNENLFVTYNQKYAIKNNPYQDEFSAHEAEPDNNGELIATQCSLDESCEFMTGYSKYGDIELDELQISLVDLVRNYEHSGKSSFGKPGNITNTDGILKGSYGRYRFKPETGDVALIDDIDLEEWFNNFLVQAPATNLEDNEIDFDKDGLLDVDELNIYKTDPLKVDTDGDGYSDGDEVASGYNPLGNGKLEEKRDDKLESSTETSAKENEPPLTPPIVSADSACLTDECYKNLAFEKKDSSICNNIEDRAIYGTCLVGVEYQNGNNNPCEVLGDDYPELDDLCKEVEEEIAEENKPIDRDAVVLSDVKIIQTALELYYNQAGKYPESIITGNPIAINGNTFLAKVPTAKKGETDICATGYEYIYRYINDEDYNLTYCLDHKTMHVPAGSQVASPEGIY